MLQFNSISTRSCTSDNYVNSDCFSETVVIIIWWQFFFILYVHCNRSKNYQFIKKLTWGKESSTTTKDDSHGINWKKCLGCLEFSLSALCCQIRRVAFASAMHIYTPLTTFGPMFPHKIKHIHQCPCALWNNNEDPVATKTLCDWLCYTIENGVNFVTPTVELQLVHGIAVFV